METNSKQKKIIQLVMEYVKSGGRVLEVRCGDGKVLGQLQKAGDIVRGTNYSKYPNAIQAVEIDSCVNINEGLPYEDASFDCVILCDVIEHFPNHIQAIREVSGVVRAGGHTIILTPNTMKIGSRLHFLFTGFFKIKQAFIGFDVPADMAFVFHNNPPHLPVFLYHLHSHYLETVKVYGANYKFKSIIFWLAFAPVIVPYKFFKTFVSKRNLKYEGASSLLFHTLTSFEVLCAEYWISVNKKVDPSLHPRQLKTKLPAWVQKSIKE